MPDGYFFVIWILVCSTLIRIMGTINGAQQNRGNAAMKIALTFRQLTDFAMKMRSYQNPAMVRAAAEGLKALISENADLNASQGGSREAFNWMIFNCPPALPVPKTRKGFNEVITIALVGLGRQIEKAKTAKIAKRNEQRQQLAGLCQWVKFNKPSDNAIRCAIENLRNAKIEKGDPKWAADQLLDLLDDPDFSNGYKALYYWATAPCTAALTDTIIALNAVKKACGA
jgi:hypothetical protein